MFHFVSAAPSTVDVHPLSKYKKTFFRAFKKAQEENRVFVPEMETRPMNPISEMDLTAFDIIVFRQGGFTVAHVRWMDNPITFGVCKRNAEDKDNPARGEHIAVRRAIQNLFPDEVRELNAKDVDSFVTPATTPANDGEPFEVTRHPFGKEGALYSEQVPPGGVADSEKPSLSDEYDNLTQVMGEGPVS